MLNIRKKVVSTKGDGSESLQEDVPNKKWKSSKRNEKSVARASKKSRRHKKLKLMKVVIEEESSEHTQSLVRYEKRNIL